MSAKTVNDAGCLYGICLLLAPFGLFQVLQLVTAVIEWAAAKAMN